MDASRRQVLAEAVGKARARIQQIRERGESLGEQDTKATLIEPVLSALGWRLEELDDVRREFKNKSQDSPVDYALFALGQPRLLVEARAFGSVLDRKCASDVLGSASVTGVPWCLFTNGDDYRLYNLFAGADIEGSLFRTLRLSDANQEAHFLESLSLLAKDSMGENRRMSELDVTCYKMNGISLFLQDAFDGMARLPDQSFDLAIVDPPYGASTAAIWHLPKEHELKGFGGEWKLAGHEWDMLVSSESLQQTLHWLRQLKRLVRPTGSIWIHGTYHNIGFVNVGCQLLGLEIINEVVWFKRNAFPNLSRRRLTASHETILWVHTGGPRKRRYRFNYEEVKAMGWQGDSLNAAGKQLRTVWDISNNKSKSERADGSHPTQKPLRLTSRLLEVAGTPEGALLVPFAGSGTELVAAHKFGMSAIGFEKDPGYFEHCRRRLERELQPSSRPSLW